MHRDTVGEYVRRAAQSSPTPDSNPAIPTIGASGSDPAQTLAAGDEPARFYVLWRYAYRAATLDAGEAIIFANGTHVELDGPKGLSAGAHAIVEKSKGKYRLRDFTERGKDEHVGQRGEDGKAPPRTCRPASSSRDEHLDGWMPGRP